MGMEDLSIIPEPEKPAGFDRDLKSFDELLFVVWHAVESAEKAAHWVVYRRIPEFEKKWVVRSGIFLQEEVQSKPELVMDYVRVDDRAREFYIPLDRRFLDKLASIDPGRYKPGWRRKDSFKAMMRDRDTAVKKERAEEMDCMVRESVEDVVTAASTPTGRKPQGRFHGANLTK